MPGSFVQCRLCKPKKAESRLREAGDKRGKEGRIPGQEEVCRAEKRNHIETMFL